MLHPVLKIAEMMSTELLSSPNKSALTLSEVPTITLPSPLFTPVSLLYPYRLQERYSIPESDSV